jgi:PilZ domain-containing protein
MLTSVRNDYSGNLRCAVRFPLRLPVSIYANGVPEPGVTQNISAAGALINCSRDYPVGSNLRFSITMPAQSLGASHDVQMECTGRVVRCTQAENEVAVAVIIDEYHVVR